MTANCTSALANLPPPEGRAGAATAARAAAPALGFAFLSIGMVSPALAFALFLFFLTAAHSPLESDLLEEVDEDREDAAFCDPVCRNLHDPFVSMNLHGVPAL